MAKKKTHSKQLLTDMADVVPGVSDEELERLVDLVDRERERQVQSHESDRKESKDGSSDGLPWRYHYEDAVASVVRNEAKKDSELAIFRTEVLNGKLFEKLEEAMTWVANLAGFEYRPEQLEKLNFEQSRERDRELIESMPDRSPSIVFPMIDRLIGLFVSIPLPPNPPLALDRLKKLSQRIAQDFGWLEEAATFFILTGNTLARPAYLIHTKHCKATPCMTRIVIEVDPAFPPDLVADLYRKERSKLKHVWHKPSVKHLKLAEFVARRSDLRTWRDKWDEWNSLHSQWGAKSSAAWAYRPIIPTRSFTIEEYEAARDHLIATDRADIIPALENKRFFDYDAFPENFEELVEMGYHNFRRDAARARLRLLDPCNWKPKKRKDTNNG